MPNILINKINIYYELHGPEVAPVLVLNNGIIMNAATSWGYQTQALSKNYCLLQYDLRGQGQSDHPAQSYSMELHAIDLFELLRALDIEKAHVAGISYGGEVAQAFTLLYPKMVSSLILADTVSEVHDDLCLVIQSWKDALATTDPRVFFNATVPWNFSSAFISSNQVLLEDALNRYRLLDFAAVTRLCDSFLAVDFTDRLGEIRAPTCIIVGSEDKLKGVVYAELLHRGILNSEYHILDGSGHATCWERPKEFNTIILGFLAKHSER